MFLKGCPLSCLWCHNPESMAGLPEIRVFDSRCRESGACAAACPQDLAAGPNLPDPARCLRCGRCADACPTGARQLVGRTLSVDQVLVAVERDRPFYDESGGGITFSGGEPLFQPGFLVACLANAQRRGLHTTVDTSGFASPAVLRTVAQVTDLFLFDLKVLDPDRHRRYTGVPLEPILRNLRMLDETRATVWLRLPLVPGHNDDTANLEAVGRLAAGLRHTRRLHLLPYHRLGAQKSARVGRIDRLGEVETPPAEAVEKAAALLRRFDLDVRIGG